MKNIYIDEFYYGLGRRKEAVARVYLKKGNGNNKVNKNSFLDYFHMDPFIYEDIYSPLKLLNKEKEYDLSVRVRGGGFSAQAEAIKLGIARALLKVSGEYKALLKSFNLLKPKKTRKKERKKIGLRKA